MNFESEPPGREHSSWWKSSRLKRHSPLLKLETVCLSAPTPSFSPRYMEQLLDILLPLQKCLWVCHFTRNLSNYLGHFFWSVLNGNNWGKKKAGRWKKKNKAINKETSVLLFLQDWPRLFYHLKGIVWHFEKYSHSWQKFDEKLQQAGD